MPAEARRGVVLVGWKERSPESNTRAGGQGAGGRARRRGDDEPAARRIMDSTIDVSVAAERSRYARSTLLTQSHGRTGGTGGDGPAATDGCGPLPATGPTQAWAGRCKWMKGSHRL
jgi:hypothetical protein